MLIPYVRCMRYAVKRVFDVDYSDSDIMNSSFERIKKSDTPFMCNNLPLRKHLFCLFNNLLYFRFWNKNHYDYYVLKVPFYSLIGFRFFDFKSEVSK